MCYKATKRKVENAKPFSNWLDFVSLIILSNQFEGTWKVGHFPRTQNKKSFLYGKKNDQLIT